MAHWDNNIGIKWKNADEGFVHFSKASDFVQADGNYVIKIKIVVDGNKVTGYASIMKTDGTWQDFEAKTFTTADTTVAIGFSAANACTWSDIKVTVNE